MPHSAPDKQSGPPAAALQRGKMGRAAKPPNSRRPTARTTLPERAAKEKPHSFSGPSVPIIFSDFSIECTARQRGAPRGHCLFSCRGNHVIICKVMRLFPGVCRCARRSIYHVRSFTGHEHKIFQGKNAAHHGRHGQFRQHGAQAFSAQRYRRDTHFFTR